MITSKLLSVFFLVLVFLTPACSFAQATPGNPLLTPPAPTLPSSQLAQSATPPEPPHKRRVYPYFFAGAAKHPLTPRDVALREAVRSLGVDRHHFVRCDLLDGTSVKGGILSAGQESFQISQGILDGQRRIYYASLKTSPRSDAAPAEHFANGMQWTGFVALTVVASPLILLMGLSCGFSCS